MAHAPVPAPEAPAWEQRFDRWVTVDDLSLSLRYRSVFDENNVHEFDQGQQRSIVGGRFKFDPQGRYSVVFHASSGHYFNWAYADFMGGGNEQALALEKTRFTPLQSLGASGIPLLDESDLLASQSSGGWSMSVRRLYLDLEPVPGLELQYGSLDIDRGAASEITTYDYDGYIDGERVSIKKPGAFFFDEASVTYAYLGDLYQPNFFLRGNRLARSNYHQFLLAKRFGKRIESSFDYTFQDKAHTLHEAAKVDIPESRLLDSVRLETYQRLNGVLFPKTPVLVPGGIINAAGNGFAVTLDKQIVPRLAMQAGVARIDVDSVILTQISLAAVFNLGLNGDQYGLGNRFFVRPAIKLTPYLELNGFYTHDFDTQTASPTTLIWNKQALNAGLVFDLKKALFREKSVQ